jgi:hypothetical protein
MPAALSRVDEFLLKEYDAAKELTFHIDELRARLTSYFITLSGVAVAALSFFLRSTERDGHERLTFGIIVASFGAVAALGFVVVLIVARLRAVQLEHFRIINNVREWFLEHNVDAWNTVELSRKTLPANPNRKSGSYFWMAAIGGLGGLALGIGLYILLFPLTHVVRCTVATVIAAAVVLVYWFIVDLTYLRVALPRVARPYKESPNPRRR